MLAAIVLIDHWIPTRLQSTARSLPLGPGARTNNESRTDESPYGACVSFADSGGPQRVHATAWCEVRTSTSTTITSTTVTMSTTTTTATEYNTTTLTMRLVNVDADSNLSAGDELPWYVAIYGTVIEIVLCSWALTIIYAIPKIGTTYLWPYSLSFCG